MDAVVIGDIAGQYQALRRLLKKCPDREPISVGDMIDRGPQSLQVMKFFANNGRAIMGNHEHMFADHPGTIYDRYLWADLNGGNKTLKQFGDDTERLGRWQEWTRNLPLYIMDDEYLITHAPLAPGMGIYRSVELAHARLPELEDSILWNRAAPSPRKQYQIFGHLGTARQYVTGDTEFATCVDSTHHKKITAIILPERIIVSEPFR